MDGSEGKEMVRSLFSGAIRKTISNKELRKDISWESVSSIQHGAKSDTPADTLQRTNGLDTNARSYVVLPTYEKAFKRKPPSTSSISTSSNDSKSSGSATSESSRESCKDEETSKSSTLDDSFKPTTLLSNNSTNANLQENKSKKKDSSNLFNFEFLKPKLNEEKNKNHIQV